VPASSVNRCVICGRRSSYLVQVGDANPADSPNEGLNLHQSAMCHRHAQEAVPDVRLPRLTLARHLAAHPAPGRRRTKHYEEYLVGAVLVLLFDGIFWANEAEAPSVGRLAAGLLFAVLGALILFEAYVVRLRAKLERDNESAGSDQAADA
jgi:hypothetical protein